MISWYLIHSLTTKSLFQVDEIFLTFHQNVQFNGRKWTESYKCVMNINEIIQLSKHSQNVEYNLSVIYLCSHFSSMSLYFFAHIFFLHSADSEADFL